MHDLMGSGSGVCNIEECKLPGEDTTSAMKRLNDRAVPHTTAVALQGPYSQGRIDPPKAEGMQLPYSQYRGRNAGGY